MTKSQYVLVDQQDQPLLRLDIQSIEDGWYYGWGQAEVLPPQIQRDLDWYDDILSSQSLSYLDEAEASVERHQLAVRLDDGAPQRVHSLHLAKTGEVTFRITPVEPATAVQHEALPANQRSH
jgi:hypothetical protein